MSDQNQAFEDKYPIGEDNTISNKLSYIVNLLNLILVQQQEKQLFSLLSRRYYDSLKPRKSIKSIISEFESAYPDLIVAVEGDGQSDHPLAHELLREIFYLSQAIGIHSYSKKLANSNLMILAKVVVLEKANAESSNQTDSLLKNLFLLRSLFKNYTPYGYGLVGITLGKVKSEDSKWLVSRYDISINVLTMDIAAAIVKNPLLCAHPDVQSVISNIYRCNLAIKPVDTHSSLLKNVLFGANDKEYTSVLLALIYSATIIDRDVSEQVIIARGVSNTEIDRVYFPSLLESLNKEKIIYRINSIETYHLIDTTPAYSSLAENISTGISDCYAKVSLKKPFALNKKKRLKYDLERVINISELNTLIKHLSNAIITACKKAPVGFNSLIEVSESVIQEYAGFLGAGVSKTLLDKLKAGNDEAILLITENQVDFIKSARQSLFENVTQLVITDDGSIFEQLEDAAFAKELVDNHWEGDFIEICTALPKDDQSKYSFSKAALNIEDNSDSTPIEDISNLDGKNLEDNVFDIDNEDDISQKEALSEIEALILENENSPEFELVSDETKMELNQVMNEPGILREKVPNNTKSGIASDRLLQISQQKSSELASKLVELENIITAMDEDNQKLEEKIIKLSSENDSLAEELLEKGKDEIDNSLVGQLNQLIGLYCSFSHSISDKLIDLDLNIGRLMYSNPENMINPVIQDKLHDLFDARHAAIESNPSFIDSSQASGVSEKSSSGLKATDFEPSLSYSLDCSILNMILDKKSSLESSTRIPTVSDIRTTLNMLTTTLNNLKNYDDIEKNGNVTDQARHMVLFQAQLGLDAINHMAKSLIQRAPENKDMADKVLSKFLEQYDNSYSSISDSTFRSLIEEIRSSISEAVTEENNLVKSSAATV
jgi:hypothetical protein